MYTLIQFAKTDKYKQAVVGEASYQSDLDSAFQSEGEYIEVDLELEDHNKYDKNAVRIVYGLETIGYLSRHDALTYRATIKRLGHATAVGTCHAKITSGGDDKHYGIQLDLDIHHPDVHTISQPKSKKFKVPYHSDLPENNQKNKPATAPLPTSNKVSPLGVLIIAFFAISIFVALIEKIVESLGQ